MNKNYIMASIKPFVMKQEVSVYLNDNCQKTVYCTIDDIEKTIAELADAYDIQQVDIIERADMYSTRIKDHLTTQYANKNLNVVIW